MNSSPVPSKPGDRIRVLVLIKGLGIGGAESLIASSAEAWDRSRFEYHVAYLLPWKDQLVDHLEQADVPVTCVDWKGPSDLVGLARLRALVRSLRPDIIHSHLPVAGILGRLFGRASVQVYTEHNVVDFYRQPTRWLNRVTYGLSDAVIAVSEAVKDSISRYPGPEPVVIPNGVDVPPPTEADKQAVRRELGLSETDPLIVHVGNIRPHKGHENLTQAVTKLVQTIPNSTVVSIGGEKVEGDLKRVRDRAFELGVNEQIKFLGRRPDALAFLAAADVVVNPSDVEGLPVSILEALSYARPLVATAVGGVPSVVIDHQTGLLVPPDDPERLAAAIATALESPDASAWGMAGAALVAQSHGLSAMVRAYEHVYESLRE